MRNLKKSVNLVLIFTVLILLTSMTPAKNSIEVTLMGSYFVSTGEMSTKSLASDLYTGVWSPWFGKGHTSFHWGAGPQTLDEVIGKAVMDQQSSLLAGVRIGYNINSTFQLELYFSYGFGGMEFNETAWNAIQDAYTKSVSRLEDAGRTVNATNNSIQSAGATYMFGFNLNINLMQGKGSSFIPYFSIGVGGLLNNDAPSIDYDLQQSFGWYGGSTYGLIVTYDTKMSIVPQVGFGVKIPVNPTMGIKIEARGMYAPLSADQNVQTSFSRTTHWWGEYDVYNKTAVTQTGGRIIFCGGFGIYFNL